MGILDEVSDPRVHAATAEIPDLMQRAHVPGLSIALVSDTGRWTRGFGVVRAGTTSRIRPDTIYQAASLSKPMFAYAVLRLAERGGIELDAPLTRYLPDAYVANDPLLDQITARRVLCHTTGWPNWRPPGQPLRRERALGEKFGYSGEGYLYLQRAIEQLTGAGLEAFMRRSLLDPLGMTQSSFVWAAPDAATVATSHDQLGIPCPRHTGARPEASSSLHASAEEYAHFLAAMLSDGGEPWRLSPAGIAKMLRPHVSLNDAMAWGLGWGLQVTNRGRAFWHWGDNPGYQSLVMGWPDLGEGIVIMTNGDSGRTLWQPILHTVFEEDQPLSAWLASCYETTAPS